MEDYIEGRIDADDKNLRPQTAEEDGQDGDRRTEENKTIEQAEGAEGTGEGGIKDNLTNRSGHTNRSGGMNIHD